MDEIGHRVLRVRAANAVDHTGSLAAREPAWGSEIHPLAGGWLVLAGPGMYLNRALVAGADDELTASELDLLLDRSRAIGVVPTFEVTPLTLPQTVRRLRERGFAHDPTADITCLTRSPDPGTVDASDAVVVRTVESEEDLRIWQETSATGWGACSVGARRASDAFAAAANALDHEHLVVAFDRVDGRPLGCATTTVRDGVAMLGGMSTIPAERRRGVQAALIRHRLDEARRWGCDLAVTTTASGGASERNVRRHGFELTTTIQRFDLPVPRLPPPPVAAVGGGSVVSSVVGRWRSGAERTNGRLRWFRPGG